MEMGLYNQHGGLRCNRGGCNINLPTPGSRTGWVTYCSHLLCGPCGRESVTQGVCFACHTDLSVSGRHEPAKISRVNLAPTHEEKQMMLAGMCPSDILDVAKAGIEFHQHQKELEVKLTRALMSKQAKKMEAAHQFHEQVVDHYKSHITKVELERDDLKRELAKKMHKQAQLGVVPQSFQLALEYGGQVADDLPIVDQQANPLAAFEPAEEEIELEEIDEEDFAPPPPSNSGREIFQARQLPGGNLGAFAGISSSKLQVRVEKVDLKRWGLNQSRSFLGTGQANQVVSEPQWQQRARGVKRGHKMQEDHLHLRNGKRVRGRSLLVPGGFCQNTTISPMRLF